MRSSARPALLTTSWDDGHPLDMRVAELLTRYGVAGTFYIPVSGVRERLTEGQLRTLHDAGLEIGSHTVHEVRLTEISDARVRQELVQSKAWLEDVTGAPVRMFCPVAGRFRADHVPMIEQAGYLGFRSVELLSLDFPRAIGRIAVLPTSVQAFNHPLRAYVRNMVKRRAYGSVPHLLRITNNANWVRTAETLLAYVARHGGVFHLWGHSWEIESEGDWQNLEHVLAAMGALRQRAAYATNGQVCVQYAGRSIAAAS